MEENNFVEMIQEAIEMYGEQVKGIQTFEEAGMLTNNEGVIVRIKDGSEFQITVVKSR